MTPLQNKKNYSRITALDSGWRQVSVLATYIETIDTVSLWVPKVSQVSTIKYLKSFLSAKKAIQPVLNGIYVVTSGT